jgi:hypothetical protein
LAGRRPPRTGRRRRPDSDIAADEYGGSCRDRQRPDAWHSRRALVAASLNVHPIPGYGAVEDGEHLLYEWPGTAQGPEERAGRLVGRARFTQLWKLTPGGWRLARVFSYGHAAAGETGR